MEYQITGYHLGYEDGWRRAFERRPPNLGDGFIPEYEEGYKDGYEAGRRSYNKTAFHNHPDNDWD